MAGVKPLKSGEEVSNLVEEGYPDVAGSLTAVISTYRKRLPAIVIDVSPYSVFEEGAVSLRQTLTPGQGYSPGSFEGERELGAG